MGLSTPFLQTLAYLSFPSQFAVGINPHMGAEALGLKEILTEKTDEDSFFLGLE